MEPATFVWEPHPFLIRFAENFGIRYYGLAYVLGFVIGAILLHFYWKRGRSPLGLEGQSDLFFAATMGTLIGGRLGYYLLYAPGELLQHPSILLRVWEGGMASHGGFVGVTLGIWWAAARNRVPVRTVGDIVATLAPPGLLLGRIANFLNGELWGKPTDVPWAVVFRQRTPDGHLIGQTLPSHPSQLYEAALEGLLLLVYTQWRIWRTPKVLQTPGRLAGEFLLGYALVRIFCELFREPDAGIPTMLGINRGAWLSVALALGGIVLIVLSRRRAAPPAS